MEGLKAWQIQKSTVIQLNKANVAERNGMSEDDLWGEPRAVELKLICGS